MTPTIPSLLVVDDSEADRELMTLALVSAFPGAGILQCADPILASKICQDQTFDCVLLDYNMPALDGLRLAGVLRAAHAHLPIILLTSVGDETLVADAFRGGVTDYLPKSRVNVSSIRRIVDRAIRSCVQSRLIEEQRGELETFAYALAHDFKQPIRQISIFAQLISDELGNSEVGSVKKHLTFLGESARRLGRLVDVMSEYTLLNRVPDFSDVDLNQVLASVRASIAPYLAERCAEFDYPADIPKIRGNETLMIQILQNLVLNGLIYNEDASPRVDVSFQRDGDTWELQVRDNGIGIEAEYLAEIFKPLVRLNTATVQAGAGLGLSLARKAVLNQRGDIWCVSEPGFGSVFHVRLPAV
jgi:signal transduction histidine kinase